MRSSPAPNPCRQAHNPLELWNVAGVRLALAAAEPGARSVAGPSIRCNASSFGGEAAWVEVHWSGLGRGARARDGRLAAPGGADSQPPVRACLPAGLPACPHTALLLPRLLSHCAFAPPPALTLRFRSPACSHTALLLPPAGRYDDYIALYPAGADPRASAPIKYQWAALAPSHIRLGAGSAA